MSSALSEQAAYCASGNQMIDSADIRNFRCFEEVHIQNCGRINVVVGRNATGKTALLESLFLAIGPSPEIAGRFRLWRGFEPAMVGTSDQIDEAMWADLFYQFDVDQRVSIQIQGTTNKHNRSLSIEYGASEPYVSVTAEDVPPPATESAVEFTWVRGDGSKSIVRPQFTGKGFSFPGAETRPVDATFFASGHPVPNAENVRRFSSLSKKRLDSEVISAVQREFSFIDGIDLQAHAGISMLHATIPWLPVKVPLGTISSGVSKFATLILALSEQKETVLFVDEIENGFYHDRMQSIWRALFEFCKDYDTQLFASTHSEECLKALAIACKDVADDVSLIRTEMDHGRVSLRQFRGSSFFDAALHGEVR